MIIIFKKLTSCLFILLSCIFLVFLMLFPASAIDAARDALYICVTIVLPTLFPFFVLSSFFIGSGAASKLGRILERPFSALFGTDGIISSAFIMGSVGGYPVGAKTAASLYSAKFCSKESAERALAFCVNCGPSFLIGIAGASILASAGAGWILIICHLTSAIIVGIIYNILCPIKSERHLKYKYPQQHFSFIESITSAFTSVLNVCAFVIFFAVVIRLLRDANIINIICSLVSQLFPSVDPAATNALICGSLEITSGVSQASLIENPTVRICVISAITSFGSLSVHFQTLSCINGLNLNIKPYLIGKSAQAMLSPIFTYFITRINPAVCEAFKPITMPGSRTFSLSMEDNIYLFSFSMLIIVIIFIICYITGDKDMEKEKEKPYNKIRW